MHPNRRAPAAPRPGRALAALGLVGLLAGCTSFDNGTMAIADGLANLGGKIGAPWGSNVITPPEGTTIARMQGQTVALAPLQVEPGNVWPAQEAPRATLANPDAALRGIPNYRPGGVDPATAPEAGPRRRGSSSAPPPPNSLPEPLASPAPPPITGRMAPPLPATDTGRTTLTPRGPLTSAGGTDRVRTVLTPDGRAATMHSDGVTDTIVGPDGRVQMQPATR